MWVNEGYPFIYVYIYICIHFFSSDKTSFLPQKCCINVAGVFLSSLDECFESGWEKVKQSEPASAKPGVELALVKVSPPRTPMELHAQRLQLRL